MFGARIENDILKVGERLAISFQRTLRIPDDGRPYPLPPGLGRFPLLRVEDHQDSVPQRWREVGGVFIPMYQREALWIFFSAVFWKPNAVVISLGGVNAVSGEPDDGLLHSQPQNYLVCPNQPWLDGINSGSGTIRQFVAMPLGLGYTVESVVGKETKGGIQLAVFEPKPGRFPNEPPPPAPGPIQMSRLQSVETAMGLGAGGSIKQKIYRDPYGLEAWEQQPESRICVHIVNSLQFEQITGRRPPPTPINAKSYSDSDLPWFDLYDESLPAVDPPPILTTVQTVAERDAELGNPGNEDSFAVPDSKILKLHGEGGAQPSPIFSRASARKNKERKEKTNGPKTEGLS
jgi:hypothetical protein